MDQETLQLKIDELEKGQLPSQKDLAILIEELNNSDEKTLENLYKKARLLTEKVYGKEVFIRGLIEFSNYCKNNCYYCGIRNANHSVDRYRLSREEILECCKQGYALDFRTFVLQSGEDDFYSAEDIAEITRSIKKAYPDCAVTLSVGERSRKDYELFRNAGADRYLLRHETACPNHYKRLKPPELLFENRMRCLSDLKELGFQTGAGFMVGSPFQTYDSLAKDLLFLKEFSPHMVGIGPFIPHHATPFKDYEQGSVKLTLIMISLTRLILPQALIPSTTALGTADPLGREKGILAGANVVMPNLSPVNVRKKYELYENKICTSSEAAECQLCLKRRLSGIQRKIALSRGDYKGL